MHRVQTAASRPRARPEMVRRPVPPTNVVNRGGDELREWLWPLTEQVRRFPYNSLQFTAELFDAHRRDPTRPIVEVAQRLGLWSGQADPRGTNCIGQARTVRREAGLPVALAPCERDAYEQVVGHGVPFFRFKKAGDPRDQGVVLFELSMAADFGPIVVRRCEPTVVEGIRRIDGLPSSISYEFEGDDRVRFEYRLNGKLSGSGYYPLDHVANPDSAMTGPLTLEEPMALVFRRGSRREAGGPEVQLDLLEETVHVKRRGEERVTFELRDRDQWERVLPEIAPALELNPRALRRQVASVASSRAEPQLRALRDHHDQARSGSEPSPS